MTKPKRKSRPKRKFKPKTRVGRGLRKAKRGLGKSLIKIGRKMSR